MVATSKEIDIVITTAYSPISMSIKQITETYQSILQIRDFKNRKVHYNLFIAIDGQTMEHSSRAHNQKRQKWIKKIHKLTLEQGMVIINTEWGHLSGSISYVIREFCQSRFLLIVQDDLKFVRDVPIENIIECMQAHKEIKHVRFNKRQTKVAGLDTEIEEMKFHNMSLVKTNNWSDNNYITSRSHFLREIMPRIANQKTFPENILRPLNLINPDLFGTFIFGELEEAPCITHLGGTRGRLRARYGKSKIVGRIPWLYKPLQALMNLVDLFRKMNNQIR